MITDNQKTRRSFFNYILKKCNHASIHVTSVLLTGSFKAGNG